MSDDNKPVLTDYMRAELVRFSDEAEVLSNLQDQVDVVEDTSSKDILLESINQRLLKEGFSQSLSNEFEIVSVAGVDTILAVNSALVESYVAQTGNNAYVIHLGFEYMDVGTSCEDVCKVHLIPKADIEVFGQFIASQYLRKTGKIYSIEVYDLAVPDIGQGGWRPGAAKLNMKVLAPGGIQQQLVPTFDGRSIKLIRTKQDLGKAEAIKVIGGKNIDQSI